MKKNIRWNSTICLRFKSSSNHGGYWRARDLYQILQHCFATPLIYGYLIANGGKFTRKSLSEGLQSSCSPGIQKNLLEKMILQSIWSDQHPNDVKEMILRVLILLTVLFPHSKCTRIDEFYEDSTNDGSESSEADRSIDNACILE